MYCDNCGCELGPDMKVCPVCGKKVEDMAADNGNSVRMEDVASQVADVSKNEDIGKELPDISKEANAAVVDTDEMEEEGTTVLKAVDLDKKVSRYAEESGNANAESERNADAGTKRPPNAGTKWPSDAGTKWDGSAIPAKTNAGSAGCSTTEWDPAISAKTNPWPARCYGWYACKRKG